MKQRYQIITIYEEDHGCEGIPEGEEPMDQVLLRTEAGEEHWTRIADAVLRFVLGIHKTPGYFLRKATGFSGKSNKK